MRSFDTGSVIAVCALMTVLFGLIQISVWPLNKRMDRLEAGQAKIENKLDKVLFELKDPSHKPDKQAKK